jgi:2'-5' RNA ligase
MLSVGQKKKNFNATLEGLKFFPNQRHPKILWLGIQPEHELIDLYDRLSKELGSLGLKLDPRPYRPHLTIGRFKRSPKQTATLCPFLSHNCGSLTIDRMILFHSKLTVGGAVHTPIQTATLLGTGY